MSEQQLRDRRGTLLGKIKTLSTGKLEIRDAHGVLRGTYDPKRDETRDARGKLVGKGNLLATLLPSS
jgi:hypothetical protein